MVIEKETIEQLIADYEQDILGNRYTYVLSNGETVSFRIEPRDIPHLMGVRKLPLRQTYQKSADAVYQMLKDGRITLKHIAPHKEEYKKVMNFKYLISILHCGDAVKVVRRVGRLNSSYLFYLDHSPQRIIHLGILYDGKTWHPESLLVTQSRTITAYIDGQQPVDILNMSIE